MSGGDHLGGLALAIALASICMLVVPAGIGGVVGYFALRVRRDPDGDEAVPPARRGALGAVLGAILGAVLGITFSIRTFNESLWNPPVAVHFVVPPGFAHDSVIVLDDPSAPPLPLEGRDLPFSSPQATVVVPPGGVVRLRGLDRLWSDDRTATLSDGRSMWGFASAPAPPGIGADHMIVFDFVAWPNSRDGEISDLEGEAAAAMIRAREAER